MLVEVAVGHIVDATTGAAHEKSAQHKHAQQMPARKAAAGQPQGAEGGPQQQQPTGGSIEANQVEVEREGAARQWFSHGVQVQRSG